jgi:hypothetical protein
MNFYQMSISLVLLVVLALVRPSYQVNITCYPCAVSTGTTQFVGFEKAVYKYQLPELLLQNNQTNYTHPMCCPGNSNRRRLTFAAGPENLNSTMLDTQTLAVIAEQNYPAPPAPPRSYSQCVNSTGFSVCFVVENSTGYVERRQISNNLVQRIQLKKNDTVSNFIKSGGLLSNRIHLTTQSCFYRGCSNQTYYQLSIDPFRVLHGPVDLPQTGSFGCPVPPANCAVPVLLWFDVSSNICRWMWSIAPSSDSFQVTLQTYDVHSRSFFSALLGKSSSPL